MTYQYNGNTSEIPLRDFFAALYEGVPFDQWMTLQGFNGRGPAKFIIPYTVDAVNQMVAGVDAHRNDTGVNIYYRMAPLRERPTNGKRGGEKETAGVGWLWCDLDTYNTTKPATEAIDALEQFTHPPSFIIHTGRGVQAGWKLREFCTDLEMIKAVNKWLEIQFKDYGADSVGDYARVLRVPTTFNHKTDPPGEATILVWRPERIYDVGDFGWAPVESVIFREPLEVESLPDNFLQDIRKIGKSGELIYKRILSEETAKESGAPLTDSGNRVDRSANDWFITKSLLSLGYTEEQVMAVLTHDTWFSGSRFQQQKNYDYINRTIQGAAFKLDGDPSQYFEVVTGKTAKFIPEKMMDAIIRSGTPFLRLMGMKDKQVDGLWCYRKGVFRGTGEQFIREEVVTRLRKFWASRHAEDTIKLMESHRGIPEHILYEDPVRYSANECFINTLSGMVNVATGDLMPHDPAYCSFLQLPLHYDPTVGAGEIDAYIRSVIPADAVDVFWEYIGFCLLLDYRYKKSLFLLGDRDTGKSTICLLLRRFFGRNGALSASLQDICDAKFQLSNLLHIYANIYPDLPSTDLKNYGKFKGITGGDSVTGENKFERPFDFTPTAKHVYSANAYVPTSDPEVDAYVNRWIVIPLTNVFRVNPQGDEEGVQRANTRKIEEISTPQHMTEMFNLALKGLQRLLSQDGFSFSKSVDDAVEEYRELLDSVYACVHHAMEPAPKTATEEEGFISKEEMLQGYSQWCGKGENRFPVGGNKFHTRMKTIMQKFKMREGSKRIPVKDNEGKETGEKKLVRGYYGRRWKSEHIPSNGYLTKKSF